MDNERLIYQPVRKGIRQMKINIFHEIGDLCPNHQFTYRRDNLTGGQRLYVYDKNMNYIGDYRVTDYMAELIYEKKCPYCEGCDGEDAEAAL